MKAILLAAISFCLLSGHAEARASHHHHGHHSVRVAAVSQDHSWPVDDRYSYMNSGEWVWHEVGPKAPFEWQKHSRREVKINRTFATDNSTGSNVAAAVHRGLAWCGAYMADKLGISGARGRELWVARNWAREGHATSAHVGAIVVYAHHVAQIVGGSPGHWIMNSGNDGHQVRTRERSIGRAIAIRDV